MSISSVPFYRTSNTAFSIPAGLIRQSSLPVLPVPVGHSWKRFSKSSGKKSLLKGALHSMISNKLAQHAIKHTKKARL